MEVRLGGETLIGDPAERMEVIMATMREMSSQTDAQEMSRAYHKRMQDLIPVDRLISLSRRGLSNGQFRVTRNSDWKQSINPWKEKDKLPLLEGGFVADLIYADEPVLINDLHIPADDPAAPYLQGMRSLMAVPMFDQGVVLNMVLLMRQEPQAFSREQFPEIVWMSNLFGRATHSLVLSEKLSSAYHALDGELKMVAQLQRSLLPSRLPSTATMALAAHYEPIGRAGGDYYDVLPLPDGKLGILIADVSGHGTPAAMLMAVLHTLVHTFWGPLNEPARVFAHVNRYLTSLYTVRSDAFVTAFYGVYDPETRQIVYSLAGHHPPRLKHLDGSLAQLDQGRSLPLGISPVDRYHEGTYQLRPGDQLVLCTDGILEAVDREGELFGLERLDDVLEHTAAGAPDLLRSVLAAVEEFTGGEAPRDDRTVLVAKIS